MDLGSANEDTDPYNFSKFEGNDSTSWGKIASPISDYNIWGYTGKPYNFTVNYTALSPKNTTMVFYWNCSGNKSDHSPDLPLNDRNNSKWKYPPENDKNNSKWKYPPENDKNNSKWKYPHLWNESGTYLVAVGIFNGPASNISCPNISYWVPIEIRNNTTIEVKNFYMLDENEGFGCSNSTYKVLSSDDSENNSCENNSNENNSSENNSNENNSCENNSNENNSNENNSGENNITEDNRKYCGYVKTDYSFSAILNATSLGSEDNRTINGNHYCS